MQLYLRKIEQITVCEVVFPLALREFQNQSPALSSVALPALFAKNILIRPPLPSELEKIWEKFYMYEDSNYKPKLASIVSNEGYHLHNNIN